MSENIFTSGQIAIGGILAQIDALKAQIDALGKSRELSVAKTKLDEARMWATEHVLIQEGVA